MAFLSSSLHYQGLPDNSFGLKNNCRLVCLKNSVKNSSAVSLSEGWPVPSQQEQIEIKLSVSLFN